MYICSGAVAVYCSAGEEPEAGQLCVWKWIVIISCPSPAQPSQAVGIDFLHSPAVNDRYMEGRGEERREDRKMHINFLTVNKLDEEKILLILRITTMPMENERTPTTTQSVGLYQRDRLTD